MGDVCANLPDEFTVWRTRGPTSLPHSLRSVGLDVCYEPWPSNCAPGPGKCFHFAGLWVFVEEAWCRTLNGSGSAFHGCTACGEPPVRRHSVSAN